MSSGCLATPSTLVYVMWLGALVTSWACSGIVTGMLLACLEMLVTQLLLQED